MAFSEEWYETELKSSELETLHRPPTVEYSFYTAVKTGDMETVVANCKEDAFIHLEGTGVLSQCAYQHKISFCSHCRHAYTLLH